MMIKKISQPATSRMKWPHDEVVHYELIEQFYKLTNHTKLLDTQYRITTHYYHTNEQLCRWKFKACPSCDSCPASDTLPHHFVNCYKKYAFWSKVDRWKKNVLNININESTNEKLLGIHNFNNIVEIDCLNFINMCCKLYIRESEEKSLYLSVFLVKLKALCRCISSARVKNVMSELCSFKSDLHTCTETRPCCTFHNLLASLSTVALIS